jgi:hydroxypyruvate reductase
VKKGLTEPLELRRAAREIFGVALESASAGDAVRRAVRLEGAQLTVCETTVELNARRDIYALAIGKAAFPMAAALDEVLGQRLTEGYIVGTLLLEEHGKIFYPPKKFITPWRDAGAGAHPLPSGSSFVAAQAAFELLRRANEARGLIIFLISGGGSAMIEWPRDERITRDEVRTANRALIACGANIAEINAVRRAFSAVKGGGLAACAPDADQLSLIVSDTGRGQESIVASGPTLEPPPDAPLAAGVIARYNLSEQMPASIMQLIKHPPERIGESGARGWREHYVLVDNDSALEAASAEARRRGFMTEVAHDISEQRIEEGCALSLARLAELRRRAAERNQVACLISGGEFSCPVRGAGKGGRNLETALRCAFEMERLKGQSARSGFNRMVILSAGTDGIDGNSPAAGAMADDRTLARARAQGLDARSFLDESDAYTFFDILGDALMTGATGTNVRDVRIMLAV